MQVGICNHKDKKLRGTKYIQFYTRVLKINMPQEEL